MICWSCEKGAGAGPLCAACGAVQPPDPAADHFQVLGVERDFALDLADLERRYKELTRTLHPDRFARADPRARRASLARSVQLNEAWRTLKDPVRRAEYLLAKVGVEVGGEDTKSPVPPALLMEVMALREGLAEARTARDDARVARLAAEVRGRRDRALAEVAASFGRGAPSLEAIAGELVAVRYFDRFLEEVVAHEEAAEARHGG